MRRIRHFTMLLLVLTVPLVACGDDDDPTGPDLQAQFEGSWTTQSFTYTAQADQSVSVDITNLGLGIQSLNVTESAAFSGVLSLPDGQGGAQTINITGQLENITESSMTINFAGAADQAVGDLDVTYALEGNILTFESDDVDFDFNQDGTPIPASVRVVLVRN